LNAPCPVEVDHHPNAFDRNVELALRTFFTGIVAPEIPFWPSNF